MELTLFFQFYCLHFKILQFLLAACGKTNVRHYAQGEILLML